MSANLDDITDPSDWLNTPLSSLSTLDAALRCQVCKEFYDTPMITNCSHTFCSLCIRRCLSNDGKCPTCRSEEQSSKLRRNWTIQECVDAFVTSRKPVLELAKSRGGDENPKRKRRKLNSDSQGSQGNADMLPPRQTRSSARGSASLTSSQEVISIGSDDEDGEYRPEQKPEPVEPDDGLVACPMCNQRMKEDAVFGHLDRCDGEQKKKSKTPPPALRRRPQVPQKIPPSPVKHLPHLNYSLLKDTALRKKLQELGIPTWGARQLLIRRHTQWVDISNANSDSPKPKTNRELLRELDVWERTQGGHAPGQGQPGPTGVMKKDFNGSEWAGQNKSQFDDLIAKARAKRSVPKSTKTQDEKGEAAEKGMDNDDPMEDVTLSNSNEAPVRNYIEPNPTPTVDRSLKIDITPSVIERESAPAIIDTSPVAAILHSAAQDVKRRNSTSTTLPTGVARLTSALSASSLPSSPVVKDTISASPPSVLNGPQGSSRERRKSVFEGARTMPMFQMPEEPIADADGVGATMGGG